MTIASVIFLLAIAPFSPPAQPPLQFGAARINVRDYGAKGDGATNDTAAINRAIEQCSVQGGGDVVFPKGVYPAASIQLRSHLRLVLDSETIITGAASGYAPAEPNPYERFQDFGHSHFHNALMWGENLEDFAIEGGQVNGGHIIQGDPKPRGRDIGDKVIAIRVGRNLRFHNITHVTGGHFVYLLDDCENVALDHVTILKSRDAVDFMGCRNVQVHDCHFTGCVDDTIGVKSDWALGRKILSANFYVWDDYFESGCNGVQFGSETAGDFQNINFWNLRIARAMKAGIGITCNDGGVIDGVNYRDITITGAACPIYFLITDRLRSGDPNKKTGIIRNVHLANVTITDCQPGRQGSVQTAVISGRPESSLENISFENLKIVYPGDRLASNEGIVPPYPKDYSPKSFGPRPAGGFYVRHVKNLSWKNVDLEFEKPGVDPRPVLVASDVDGLRLDGVRLETTAGIRPFEAIRVQNLEIRNSPDLAGP